MRRVLAHVAVTSLAVVGLLALAHGPAYADTVCQVTDPETGVCLIWIEVPGTPGDPGDPGDGGPKDTGTGTACYWDGTDQGIKKPPPGPVPCSSEYGYWSNGYNCYISLLDPQPPAGDPNWQGHEPGDGAVYNCYQPQTGILIWMPPARSSPPRPGPTTSPPPSPNGKAADRLRCSTRSASPMVCPPDCVGPRSGDARTHSLR